MTLYLIEIQKQIVIQNTFLLFSHLILKNYTSNLYLLLLYMNNWSQSVDSL